MILGNNLTNLLVRLLEVEKLIIQAMSPIRGKMSYGEKEWPINSFVRLDQRCSSPSKINRDEKQAERGT